MKKERLPRHLYIDISEELYRKIKKSAANTGQTMRVFMTILIVNALSKKEK